MTSTEVNIVNAAAEVIAQNGVGHTSMSDIARAAEVSRQTLYAHFGNKDDLLLAVFQKASDDMLTALNAAWSAHSTVSEVLDALFDIAVLAPFDVLKEHPELAEFLDGRDAPGGELLQRSTSDLIEALTAQLAPQVGAGASLSGPDLSAYIVRAAKGLKSSCQTRGELEQQLRVLKASILALMA